MSNQLGRFLAGLVESGVIELDANGRPPLGWGAFDPIETKYDVRALRHVEGCWGWLGAVNPVNGYATIGKAWAHRVSYELHIGPIPEGLTIDHTCRVHTCTNPQHLEAVTQAENNRRAFVQETCKQGHPWTAATEYRSPGNGRRMCRICAAAKMRRFRARRTAARRAAA